MKVIPFPFAPADRGALIEMYHGSHARYGNPPFGPSCRTPSTTSSFILAASYLHPAQKIPVSELKWCAPKFRNDDRRDVGAGNQPLDMVPLQERMVTRYIPGVY